MGSHVVDEVSTTSRTLAPATCGALPARASRHAAATSAPEASPTLGGTTFHVVCGSLPAVPRCAASDSTRAVLTSPEPTRGGDDGDDDGPGDDDEARNRPEVVVPSYADRDDDDDDDRGERDDTTDDGDDD